MEAFSALLTLSEGNPAVVSLTKASSAELWCYLSYYSLMYAGTNGGTNSSFAGDLRRLDNHVTSLYRLGSREICLHSIRPFQPSEFNEVDSTCVPPSVTNADLFSFNNSVQENVNHAQSGGHFALVEIGYPEIGFSIFRITMRHSIACKLAFGRDKAARRTIKSLP